MKKPDPPREDARLPLLSSAAESLVRGDASHALELHFLSAGDAVGRLGVALVELARSIEARGRLLEDVFGRSLTDDDVRKLIEAPSGLALGGERRTVTILTSEIRGFTTLSEGLAPDEVVALVGNHLGVMRRVAGGHGGTLDPHRGGLVQHLARVPPTHDSVIERDFDWCCQLGLCVVHARHRTAGQQQQPDRL